MYDDWLAGGRESECHVKCMSPLSCPSMFHLQGPSSTLVHRLLRSASFYSDLYSVRARRALLGHFTPESLPPADRDRLEAPFTDPSSPSPRGRPLFTNPPALMGCRPREKRLGGAFFHAFLSCWDQCVDRRHFGHRKTISCDEQ
jgi:hypothetical protein